MKTALGPPSPSPRMLRLVLRNWLVWRKLIGPSLVTHLAEPAIFLFGFGLGLGALVGEIGGVPYINFLAGGMVGYAAMNSASFEGMYSAFTRMHVQRTWESILNAPMTLDDVLLGEWLWAGIKGTMAAAAMLVVMAVFGYIPLWGALAALPLAAFTALVFGAMALAVNSVAPGYDFFSYYFSLFIAPMMLLSGVFFPLEQFPEPVRLAAQVLPLTHALELLRPLCLGEIPANPGANILVLCLYAGVCVWLFAVLTRRRLLK